MSNKYTETSQLQFLRFVAFMLIFLFHVDNFHLKFMIGPNGAAWAVCFFFVLSGFITGYSGYGKEVKLSIKEIFKLLFKKIEKFYPLYFSMTIFAIIISKIPVLIGYHDFRGLLPLLLQLLKNLLLIQSWFPKGYFSFCGVGWFLSTIMFLYLFNIPLKSLLNKITKSKYKYVLYIVLFLLGIFITVIYSYAVRNLNQEFYDYVLQISRIGEYIAGMTMGYIVCSLSATIKRTTFTKILFTIFEVLSIVICYYCICVYNSPAWQWRIVRWLVPAFVLILIYGFGKGYISTLFRKRYFVLLGDISFECFLIHQIVAILYIKLVGSIPSTIIGNTFSIVYILFITLSIAYYIHNKTVIKK